MFQTSLIQRAFTHIAGRASTVHFPPGLVEEARAKAIGYAVWLAVGLFALMFVSSLLGGPVVALALRRSRST